MNKNRKRLAKYISSMKEISGVHMPISKLQRVYLSGKGRKFLSTNLIKTGILESVTQVGIFDKSQLEVDRIIGIPSNVLTPIRKSEGYTDDEIAEIRFLRKKYKSKIKTIENSRTAEFDGSWIELCMTLLLMINNINPSMFLKTVMDNDVTSLNFAIVPKMAYSLDTDNKCEYYRINGTPYFLYTDMNAKSVQQAIFGLSDALELESDKVIFNIVPKTVNQESKIKQIEKESNKLRYTYQSTTDTVKLSDKDKFKKELDGKLKTGVDSVKTNIKINSVTFKGDIIKCGTILKLIKGVVAKVITNKNEVEIITQRVVLAKLTDSEIKEFKDKKFSITSISDNMTIACNCNNLFQSMDFLSSLLEALDMKELEDEILINVTFDKLVTELMEEWDEEV